MGTRRRRWAPRGLGAGLALGALAWSLAPTAAPADTPAHAPLNTPLPSGEERARGLEDALDALLERQLAEYDIPGATVVVVADGREVLARGYGTAEAGRDVPVDPAGTGFFMGSVAKVLTATAVYQQVEAGRLDLDEDVNTYLDTFTVAEHPDDARPVTVADLLTHTAGFDDAILGRGAAEPGDAEGLAEALADHQPDRTRPAGEVATYDNYGFALAGHLVERVSGQPFDAYLDEHVLTPLGMEGSTFTQPPPGPMAERLALGHRPDGDGQAVARGQYGAWSPAGAGAVTTAHDMGRLLLALLNGGTPGDAAGDGDAARVLGEESVEAMTGRRFANDERLPGLGHALEERAWGGHRLLVKDGDLPGFHANMALLPDADVGVWVAYNGDGEEGRAWWAGQEVENLVAERVWDAPEVPRAVGGAAGGDAESGFYRSLRTSASDLTRASALTTAVEVEVHDDGTLTTRGPATRDPDIGSQRWVPVGEGVFRQEDGHETLAFADGRLLLGAFPSAAWERLDWYESPVLHQILLGTGAGVLLLSALYWTARAAFPSFWRRGGGAGEPSTRVALGLGWLTCVLVSAGAICFALLVADGNRMNETILLGDATLLRAVPLLLTTAALTALGTVACAGLAWPGRWWGPVARVHYGVVALAAMGTLYLAALYNLVP
ncbi:CubicO group peptidase, beta-lactamase class C family [Streptomyces zhaozhouensis]|uniref:CubicO group peptidase, beta-lactamase class C family n=1 Tax=Streptomyces zhaozhouensis TaxID=1300267 RepID=A0A286DWU1_9ACTN|nr:serine hydrolase domain-containing protein [Streptomyces zhaozhouensis]SOD63135.1 CubicO group peptidase, beta-lactamase class C family [Streptomyces zhaozhouensis]